MGGLNNVIEMGKQGMLVSQASIQVTAKNIANVNTLDRTTWMGASFES